ncbi:50S ribosomal protein L35ae [Candidatus Micrarchaeota archaeon]|nr:50S ribosomal protein L35ae [Candidatus Micrarchaeota archaeon]
MKARIRNYRGGRHSQYKRHYVLVPQGSKKRSDAEKLKGKAVVWKSPSGKLIKGQVVEAHGKQGAVRAIMMKGLPGQALGQQIDISE